MTVGEWRAATGSKAGTIVYSIISDLVGDILRRFMLLRVIIRVMTCRNCVAFFSLPSP